MLKCFETQKSKHKPCKNETSRLIKNASAISRSCQNVPRPTFFEVPFTTPPIRYSNEAVTVNVHRLLSALRLTQSVLYNWLPNHGIHQSQLNYLFLSLTSAWTNILYISGRINGATWGIWISETSRQNSAKTKNCVINLGNNIEKHWLFSLLWMEKTTHRHMEPQAKQKWFSRPSNKRYPSWWRKKR